MEEGWVYVLVNSSMPGVVKVGRTARRPRDRAAELSGLTAVPVPLIVAYEQAFADCHAAERAVHGALDRQGLRVAANREFFRAPASEVIALLLRAGETAGGVAADVPPAGETAHALLVAGDRALFGLGAALQDTGEAVRCYKLAAAGGALHAHARLGSIYVQVYAQRRRSADRRRALLRLKEGARRDDAYCYSEMAGLFALDGHAANIAKAWALFFAGAGREDQARFAAACCRYVSQCLELGTEPGHLPELREAGVAILAALLGEMDRLRVEPALRRRTAAVLRWTYAHVLTDAGAPRDAPMGRRFAWRALAA